MKNAIIALSLSLLLTDAALPQITRVTDEPRTPEVGAAMKDAPTDVVAALASPRLTVSKTASVDGENVCGAITFANSGGQPAIITAIVDSLEVHFPRTMPAPPLPAGSTPNWYSVANTPFPVPGPIAPGTTATVPYCFSLCLVSDFTGANSMRNVVTVTIGGGKSLTTRSTSFPPPLLDCQACCTGNGFCRDTVPETCNSVQGLALGAGTNCATSECPRACCHGDGSCTDTAPSACETAGGEAEGPGTDCATTQCCTPLGSACNNGEPCCGENAFCTSGICCIALADTGCAENSDCCEEDGVAICNAGTCCAPNRVPDSCHDAADCCDSFATCNSGTCCIPLGDTGCTNLVGNDCCSGFGAVICEAGKCCAPTGASDSCFVDSDCCDPGATCNGGTCCVRRADTGCTDSSDCCENDGVTICDAGKCCAPNGIESSCHDAADCCDTDAICNGGTCCIPLGDTGCTQFGADCCDGFGTEICQGGRCCAPTGADDSCFIDTDCCDPDATCNGGTCCIRNGEAGCLASNECCDSFCVEGTCCIPSGNDCDEDLRCCAGLSCEAGICCKAPGSACSAFDTCCGTPCVNGTCCNPPGLSCINDAACCGDALCNAGKCCIPQFRTGCADDADCCSGLVCIGGMCEAPIGP